MRAFVAVLALAGLCGCGSAVGDACSTDNDCGGRTCELVHDFPGGYCTEHCTLGDDATCASGSSCQSHHGDNICLRECVQDIECRSGYVCKQFNGAGPFCLTPDDH